MTFESTPLNFLDLRRRMRENGDLSHIQHMLEFTEQIMKSIEGKSKPEFLANPDIRDVTIYRLQTIGTAAVYVSRFSRQQFPKVPWRRIINIRNKIVSNILEPDYDEVWAIIQSELPKYIIQLKEIPLIETK